MNHRSANCSFCGADLMELSNCFKCGRHGDTPPPPPMEERLQELVAAIIEHLKETGRFETKVDDTLNKELGLIIQPYLK